LWSSTLLRTRSFLLCNCWQQNYIGLMSLADCHRSGTWIVGCWLFVPKLRWTRQSQVCKTLPCKGTARDTTAASKPTRCGYRLKSCPLCAWSIELSTYRKHALELGPMLKVWNIWSTYKCMASWIISNSLVEWLSSSSVSSLESHQLRYQCLCRNGSQIPHVHYLSIDPVVAELCSWSRSLNSGCLLGTVAPEHV